MIYLGSDKKVNFSIDRLTLVAELKADDYFYFIKNIFSKRNDITQYRNISNFFEITFQVDGLGCVQLDKELKKLRIDFNPNNITLEGKKDFNFLLTFVKNIHYTRLDLAIDLFNYNISNYNIVDIGNRKSAYFYDRVGKLETIYSGSPKSSKYIRIYNKGTEQKIDNIDWWRFEIQLRDVYIDKYFTELLDFYSDILIFKYSLIDIYSIEENAMIEYLLHNISRLEKLNKNSKTKYKKIIRNLEIKSIDFLDSIISLTNEKIISWLNYISSNQLYPESTDNSFISLSSVSPTTSL